jgi:hypothetical protein
MERDRRPDHPRNHRDRSGGRLEIGVDWDWDPARGKLIDNRTGLDLLIDGQPNPAIPDAPDRPGYEHPSWRQADAEWIED